jgi:hypothetical protein
LISNVEHILVAYGQQRGYHHGAKYQILRSWDKWYSRKSSSVCVVTDKPDLFANYPIRVVEITEAQRMDWSLGGMQHFGIKLKALEMAGHTSGADRLVLLDTDTYWIKDPIKLIGMINPKQAVMFCDEGLVRNTKNTSIHRFTEALNNRSVPWEFGTYRLSETARMLNSSIIGLHIKDISILQKAFALFSVLEPLVEAHTVEQFALGETFNMEQFVLTMGDKYTSDWSSIGRKDYATPVLADFFNEFGETAFSEHLKNWQRIKIQRPFRVFASQKINRWLTKH